ncbi:unnamed protein product [Clonostachys rosea f. rosea IK726]|uniref:Uncharacterized protein n=1 Tax=Clonostachys rosea f. rosea IK726 TaxID=1349383 RepID=A0ACA9TS28_BIOOC|nr:unnamed protein product [Clonostachys rosea f. rosea IK726]
MPRETREEESRGSRHSQAQRRSRSPPSHGRRSPPRADEAAGDRQRRHRHHGGHSSASSRRRHRSPHRSERRDRSQRAVAPVTLPFSARQLTKADMAAFMPLFADFLSVQKQIEVGELDEREVRGRWKSFMGKWNRGELAEGWYDPDMFARISERYREEGGLPYQEPPGRRSPRSSSDEMERRGDVDAGHHSGSEDDDYGPTLPRGNRHGARIGPVIPSMQDLAMREEMREEDREESRNALREARKADRNLQKERLEELLPRADPGSRERKLEKRQMVNDKMREFRDKSPGMEGGDEKDLMGGGDSLAEYKKMKQQEQRKKSEREIRREEFERAKQEEVEERRRAWREREDGTMSMLKELAKQRFG